MGEWGGRVYLADLRQKGENLWSYMALILQKRYSVGETKRDHPVARD
jgi:hypothetical protein